MLYPWGHTVAPLPTWAPGALPTIPAINSLRWARRPSTREVKAAVPRPAGAWLCNRTLVTAQRRPRGRGRCSADCSVQTAGRIPVITQRRPWWGSSGEAIDSGSPSQDGSSVTWAGGSAQNGPV